MASSQNRVQKDDKSLELSEKSPDKQNGAVVEKDYTMVKIGSVTFSFKKDPREEGLPIDDPRPALPFNLDPLVYEERLKEAMEAAANSNSGSSIGGRSQNGEDMSMLVAEVVQKQREMEKVKSPRNRKVISVTIPSMMDNCDDDS